MRLAGIFMLFFSLNSISVFSYEYENMTDSTPNQLYNFENEHPKPIGVLTLGSGKPLDVRESRTINTDVLNNEFFQDSISHMVAERLPERVVHAKGTGAHGYFVVTNDISKYTKADVFNGVGKTTQVFVRFSSAGQNLGGSDVAREVKGLAVKFYTNEGILDLLNLNIPIYFSNDPVDFIAQAHAFQRNPKTGTFDNNQRWDVTTLRVSILHNLFWLFSDFGIPDGYRHMDGFAIHAFELNNKHGERYFTRFHLRTDQGLANLTAKQAAKIQGRTLDYYASDLYSAIDQKHYPSWTLYMDVLSLDEIKHLEYNPFDVTALWKKGTYKTLKIGRMVLNRSPDNDFRDKELSAFCPKNLVPGIPGPVDVIFQARKQAYRAAQNYRIGINNEKVRINLPGYAKTYLRDGYPPDRDNMKDAPNYFPNSFHGPLPFVDDSLNFEKLMVLDSNTFDLQRLTDFYSQFVIGNEHRERFAGNIFDSLDGVKKPLLKRVLRLLKLIDDDIYERVMRLKNVTDVYVPTR